MNTATRGVDFKDAEVASAMVSTMQQIGGSIGVALLSAFAAHATTAYLTTHARNTPPARIADLARHPRLHPRLRHLRRQLPRAP